MRKFELKVLSKEARSKIVLLYLGCKLNKFECSGIEEIVNKVILAGTTGKKITFSNIHNVFEVQELTKFVEDYTYERMEYYLYNGNRLKADIIEKQEVWENDKTLFLHLLEIIYPANFLEEVDYNDVWFALTKGVSLNIAPGLEMYFRPSYCESYRFIELINKAILKYEATKKS